MNKKEALKIVQKDGTKLKKLPSHFKKDKEIVLAAVKQDAYALNFANYISFINDKDFRNYLYVLEE